MINILKPSFFYLFFVRLCFFVLSNIFVSSCFSLPNSLLCPGLPIASIITIEYMDLSKMPSGSVALGYPVYLCVAGYAIPPGSEAYETYDITPLVVKWVSSDSSVATVDEVATVKHPAIAHTHQVGSTAIKACFDFLVQSNSVTVEVVPPELLTLVVNPSSARVVRRTILQFTAIGTYSDNKTQDLTKSVHWMSSNSSIATIDDYDTTKPGIAMAICSGATDITASQSPVFSAPATLTVLTGSNPVVGNISLAVKENELLSFKLDDFTANFKTEPPGGRLVKIKFVKLPGLGVLKLADDNVVVNQEIDVNDLNYLIFVPDVDLIGTTNFNWNGSDGELYSINDAIIKITINAKNIDKPFCNVYWGLCYVLPPMMVATGVIAAIIIPVGLHAHREHLCCFKRPAGAENAGLVRAAAEVMGAGAVQVAREVVEVGTGAVQAVAQGMVVAQDEHGEHLPLVVKDTP